MIKIKEKIEVTFSGEELKRIYERVDVRNIKHEWNNIDQNIYDALYPYFDKCNICYKKKKNDISKPSSEFI